MSSTGSLQEMLAGVNGDATGTDANDDSERIDEYETPDLAGRAYELHHRHYCHADTRRGAILTGVLMGIGVVCTIIGRLAFGELRWMVPFVLSGAFLTLIVALKLEWYRCEEMVCSARAGLRMEAERVASKKLRHHDRFFTVANAYFPGSSFTKNEWVIFIATVVFAIIGFSWVILK